MNRRAFLAGLTATAAGLLIPERKVWALDRTMIPAKSDWEQRVRDADLGLNFYGVPSQLVQVAIDPGYLPPEEDVNFLPIFWVQDDQLYGQIQAQGFPVYRFTGDPPRWLTV
jgi:hypothetical protein